MAGLFQRPGEMKLQERFGQISWSMVFFIVIVGCIGIAMLYSAADGDMDPWAKRHLFRFLIGMAALIAVAVIDLRIWLQYAYVVYGMALVLLVGVEIAGKVGMGAQRWIDLKFFLLQPSEVMKVGLVLALARYFHTVSYENTGRILYLIIPTVMILTPVGLVLRQPDLGTAGMMMVGGVAMFFLAGVRMWKFILGGILGLAAIPLAWKFMLRDYQKDRVLTFLDPANDPTGAGYHIMQSQIALGSGGLTGRGFLQGTQSGGGFLPEKQTDFIFTMLAEEFGLLGGLGMIGLYIIILGYGFAIAFRSRNHFGRLVALGLTTTIFLYVFINVAMVMGVVPVVGVPLPLVSYGGTAMLTVMVAFGLIMCVYVHRDLRLTRGGLDEDD
ncbi:MAG: rod shape-determining protein RodA [Proteobacteria bacterium]|nr:rod shape-determining protein RodA [Pseudomonadota bacterium]